MQKKLIDNYETVINNYDECDECDEKEIWKYYIVIFFQNLKL